MTTALHEPIYEEPGWLRRRYDRSRYKELVDRLEPGWMIDWICIDSRGIDVPVVVQAETRMDG